METGNNNLTHALPLGAVVIYKNSLRTGFENRAELIVVDLIWECDNTPLYCLSEEPIEPPGDKYKIYSQVYLAYRLHAGWYAGSVSLEMIQDTGRRVPLVKFDVLNLSPQRKATQAL